ncbi:rplQ protein [Weissella kandleri]|uniref:Large ribosomal subunit protein bL17 n=1 Tax=Weissella kandleri TaxID=1616 RepID=A0A0R2JMM1_9LACO|nr:50S ribosomal protein L17 [Weissella kandleri]KRN75332.1 rplQ protein [Weissella kandleri]
MSYRKLGRTSSQRKALLRDLTAALLVNGRIETTEARAKEVRKTAEKMITLGKHGDLASRRKAAAFMRNIVADVQTTEDDKVKVENALQYLFNQVAPRFEGRAGGYTRILKTVQRRGDAAQMVILELVD